MDNVDRSLCSNTSFHKPEIFFFPAAEALADQVNHLKNGKCDFDKVKVLEAVCAIDESCMEQDDSGECRRVHFIDTLKRRGLPAVIEP